MFMSGGVGWFTFPVFIQPLLAQRFPGDRRQGVANMDFLKHGTVVLVICLIVTRLLAFFGYWHWLGI